MEQTQHIRLSGHAEAIPLTRSAHARLLRYLADARRALGADPDADETVRDLEAALGDHLKEAQSISEGPVDESRMIEILERAGEIEGAGAVVGVQRRGSFWCRISEGKWFGGLCLGIAARGDFRVDWVRTIGIFLALITGGLIGLVYLALLLVVPSVDSVSDYRRLRDEPRVPAP